ncbi:MAG: DUF1289 domain-containing protein [Bradyrhizobiaceae bacterium]|nr:DUF1289 domain-containing protein [Bradyrhizobiaceae bacterium]
MPARNAMASTESPCAKICTFERISGLCLGCGRTLREIEYWSVFTASECASVMRELPVRLAELRRRHGASTDAG